MRDIRIHDTYQVSEFVTRFGNAGVETRLPLRRSPAQFQHPVRRRAESGSANRMVMRDIEEGPEVDVETDQTSRTADPEKIADIVYRMMLKDLVVERERRR